MDMAKLRQDLGLEIEETLEVFPLISPLIPNKAARKRTSFPF